MGSSLSGVHSGEFLVKRQPMEGVTSVSRRLFCRKSDQGDRNCHTVHRSLILNPLCGFHHRVASALCCGSVAQSCPTLCDPRYYSTPGLPIPHHLLKFAQVHVYCIGGAIQPSHPLMPSSPFALSLSHSNESAVHLK